MKNQFDAAKNHIVLLPNITEQKFGGDIEDIISTVISCDSKFEFLIKFWIILREIKKVYRAAFWAIDTEKVEVYQDKGFTITKRVAYGYINEESNATFIMGITTMVKE